MESIFVVKQYHEHENLTNKTLDNVIDQPSSLGGGAMAWIACYEARTTSVPMKRWCSPSMMDKPIYNVSLQKFLIWWTCLSTKVSNMMDKPLYNVSLQNFLII